LTYIIYNILMTGPSDVLKAVCPHAVAVENNKLTGLCIHSNRCPIYYI